MPTMFRDPSGSGWRCMSMWEMGQACSCTSQRICGGSATQCRSCPAPHARSGGSARQCWYNVETVMVNVPLKNDLADASTPAVSQAAQILRSGGWSYSPRKRSTGLPRRRSAQRGWRLFVGSKSGLSSGRFTVHLPDAESAGRYVDLSSLPLRRLIRKAFPGPVTLVVDVSEDRIAQCLEELGLGSEGRQRVYHDRTIGLRCPDMPMGPTDAGRGGCPCGR